MKNINQTQVYIESLVQKLRDASKAYYESDTPIMSDSEYDTLLEELSELNPNHPYLKDVGFKPDSNIVKLPVPMASLDKRKPDTIKPEDLNKGPYVCMDKLDGISALWTTGYTRKPSLLLRGNGLEGQDVSHCIHGIQGLKQSSSPSVMIRGELIVPKGVISDTLARNWVNGILHQKNPSKEDLSKIRFVAYQVCEPKTLTRSQQITWLTSQGYEIAWSKVCPTLTVETLSDLFQTRRTVSEYECDGIVVGQDVIPVIPSNATNPKDAFAFKMPTEDQRATTVVEDVEWASSRTGKWIPRIRFRPVQIGTATIEYCTGFHGQFIKENGIGPGAEIIIRRSGDVIPVLEKVIRPCSGGTWKEPPQNQWEWDENGVHCKDISETISSDKLALELTHQLKALGIEGISKTIAKKLVVGNITTLLELHKANKTKVQDLIGKANGEKLKDALEPCMLSAKPQQWIKAFLGWPNGFGDVRIEATLALQPSVALWPSMILVPKGQSVSAFEDVKKAVPEYLKWRNLFPVGAVASTAPSAFDMMPIVSNIPVKGHYVMSGFRDKDIQAKLAEAGWVLQERINKSTTMLLVPEDAKETTKVKAAKDAGIKIIMRNEIQGLF